ncbi:hypothetical protein OAN307_c15370 [Octadecabacter antarcticus 307]|uniref:Uncharacterized protein n=1 Tax=Octadecabacter antarcticus 307 TaxID=391626 RepID=M9RBK3_9RHOB|nr:hypothetical protein OAN307_c15370 [Octadecabacter antarcticus 307]
MRSRLALTLIDRDETSRGLFGQWTGYCQAMSRKGGTNENTNRLLRQYVPKGTDLSIYSQAKLSAVARQFNQ